MESIHSEWVIGLAAAGGRGLEIAKEIYRQTFEKREALCAPYAAVIDIDAKALPSPDSVSRWDSKKFSDSLRHIPGHTDYNLHFRQLIHIGYKVAAELGDEYYDALKKYSDIIGQCVEENIYERHLKRLFNL